MKKIVIIGGGIAGLAAAYRIHEEISKNTPVACTLIESSEKFGGKISTIRFNGFIVERGPDSFISQKPQAIELCKKLGLEDQLTGTSPNHPNTYVCLKNKLVTMPDGLSLMIPTKFLPFVFSPLFSWWGKIRMGMDLFIPKKKGNDDESLASFVRRRMGKEALEKMAEPMLAGIYASDPELMSINSTFPMFVQTEQKYRSLIIGMLERKRQQLLHQLKVPKGKQSFSLFMTLKNGLDEMVETLVNKATNINFCAETKVVGISRAEEKWRLTLHDGSFINADAILLATPAKISTLLLEEVSPKVSSLLNQIRYVSTATVSIGYKKEGFPHKLDGFGFVVPKKEGKRILACTWTSSKFPERVPEKYVMLRCFVGGAMREELAELEETAIGNMVREELLDIMGIDCEPVFLKVFKYKKSNVQYHLGHAVLIESIRKELELFPGLFVTGSAYTGIGIPDCIRDGEYAAKEAMEFLTNKINT
jgi:protoporphyrinogen/coproporphyrinogen III oxidase